MASKDRKSQLLHSPAWNGIDFVEIANTAQTALRVHFLNGVPLQPLKLAPTITGGETIPTVTVNPISPGDWGMDGGHVVLHQELAEPPNRVGVPANGRRALGSSLKRELPRRDEGSERRPGYGRLGASGASAARFAHAGHRRVGVG